MGNTRGQTALLWFTLGMIFYKDTCARRCASNSRGFEEHCVPEADILLLVIIEEHLNYLKQSHSFSLIDLETHADYLNELFKK